jgi:SAM-dependent methyltransferase
VKLSNPRPIVDSTQRFSDRVEYYVQSRPRYPQALVEFCRDELGLNPRHQIADIGSGTGFLSELFLRNGNAVFGVEPNDPMRQAAENLLAPFANFKSVKATAESTQLDAGAFDFVMAGQAFHWFDRARAKVEFRRILRPGGWVLLVWNERRKGESGGRFLSDYDAVVRDFEIDWHKIRHEKITGADTAALDEFFAPTGWKLQTFDNPQSLDLDGVIARALSSSYLPLPGQPRCDEMLQRLHEAFSRCQTDGRVWMEYETKAYYGRLA